MRHIVLTCITCIMLPHTATSSSIHKAAQTGNAEKISTICKSTIRRMFGDHAKSYDQYGLTALHYAAENGNHKAIKRLINFGAPTNAKELAQREKQDKPTITGDTYTNWVATKGTTPLHVASYHGHTDIVTYLYQNGADINSERVVTDVHIASIPVRVKPYPLDTSDKYIVALRTNAYQPLHDAVRGGNKETVTTLLQLGCDINTRSRTHTREKGISPNTDARKLHAHSLSDHETPIHIAVRQKDIPMAQHLLEHGASINVHDNNHDTPLHIAIQQSNSDLIIFLLEHGADATIPNYNGNSPLHVAIMNNDIESIRALLEHGADSNMRTDENAPSKQVWDEENIGLCLVLSRHRNHNICDLHTAHPGYRHNTTPLHIAINKKFDDIAQLLMEYHANYNAQDAYGDTPLHRAIDTDNAYIIEQLLHNGADISICNDEGHTVQQYADMYGSQEIIDLING